MFKHLPSIMLSGALLLAPAAVWARDTANKPEKTITGNSTTTVPAENPRVRGATGNTIVPGDNSTMARERVATDEQKTGLVEGK